MIKIFKSVSLILAIFIGVNAGVMAGKIKKPSRNRPIANIIPIQQCSLSVLPGGTSFDSTAEIAKSFWRVSCNGGNLPCKLSIKAIVSRFDALYDAYEFEALYCNSTNVTCGVVIPNFYCTVDMSPYGPGQYRIDWIAVSGDCDSSLTIGFQTQDLVITTGIRG